jgi:hypothetical protein
MCKMPATILALVLSQAVVADEGMWTFDNFPAEAVRKRYGVSIGRDWLDRVRGATVRLEGGCTGSFVSERGLVLTNHHCVAECVSRISTAARDVQSAGFFARQAAEELRCPAEQVSVLTRLEEVTERVSAGVGALTGAAANERRKAVLTRLEQECEDGYRRRGDPRSCEAVALYGGGQYFLYHYKRYEDVRLVFAPESAVASFGGDLDNFEFPRWNLDVAFLRAYEDGKPAATPVHFRLWRAGAAAGAPVFVPGHPGSTSRLDTVAQLRFERDVVLAHWLPRAAELRGRYLQYAAAGTDEARIVQEPLFGLENALKIRRNLMSVLLEEEFLAARGQEEQELRRAVAADPGLREHAGAWDEIERALGLYRTFYDRHAFIELGAGLQGDLAFYARMLVRAAVEREKPNETRQRGFTESALPLLRAQVLAPSPVYRDLETLRLTYSLEKMREYLGVDDPAVRLVLGRDAPRDLTARLVRETRLGDPAYRERIWDGGRAAITGSGDPLLALAWRVEPEAQRVRTRFEDEVEAALTAARERIARARFALYGTTTYPDATFTLRLSYGAIEGWREGEREIAPFTTIEGLYARATGHPPFELPARWLEARDRINLDTRFDFVTNNDIIGGNSGSPVLDARGRLVGVIFDGNRHAIGGDYRFDPVLNRAVAVHPAAIALALTEIYDAERLVRELALE